LTTSTRVPAGILATTGEEADGCSKSGVESLVSYAPAAEARRDVGAEGGIFELAIPVDCRSFVWTGGLRVESSDASVLGRGFETTLGLWSNESRGADGDCCGDHCCASEVEVLSAASPLRLI